MRKLFIWIVMNVCHLITGNLHSQPQHDKVWVYGAGVTFITTFNNDTFSNTLYIDSFGLNIYFAHGNSNICDSFGVLQCSSDGLNVYHNKHELMEGGITWRRINIISMSKGLVIIHKHLSCFLLVDRNIMSSHHCYLIRIMRCGKER